MGPGRGVERGACAVGPQHLKGSGTTGAKAGALLRGAAVSTGRRAGTAGV